MNTFAFLASPMAGLKELRAEVRAAALSEGIGVWVDETDGAGEPELPSLTTIDRLFAKITESAVVIVLLAGDRYGSPLSIGDDEAHVSYWETELFYAALSGKRVQVFEVDDFKRDPRLDVILSILRRHLSKQHWSGPYARKEVAPAIRAFLLAERRRKRTSSGARRLLSGLVEGLFLARGRDGVGGSGERESFGMFGVTLPDPTVKPNEAVIASLFDEVASLESEEGRLTRLWLLLRELSGAHFREDRHAGFLPQWNRALGEWATAGSWYGLHGHVSLAVFAALLDQARVRDRMRRLASRAWKEEPVSYPAGGLASARYSIALKAKERGTKRFLLEAALRDIERALKEGSEAPANLLAVRGSIYLRLRAYSAAVADYEAVRAHRLVNGTASQVGEALSELGFGYLFQRRFGRARELLEEGVAILSRDASRPGFLIRAKRKLAVAYALTGHPLRSRDERREANRLAEGHGVRDQVRGSR